MSWIPFVALLTVAIAYASLKRSGQISQKDATEYLKNGAIVVDVRSVSEFDSGHLMQAQNLPLDRIDMMASVLAKDKNKVLLVHCSTGVRSGMAKKKLTELGYKNVFNLGSYERAAKIVTNR